MRSSATPPPASSMSNAIAARRPALDDAIAKQSTRGNAMDPIVGRGKYTYKVDEAGAQVPQWLELKPAAVSVDSEDRVYCFNRNDAHPVVIFDRDGKFVGSWGEGLFRFPHAIRIVRENGQDVAWVCDEHLQ